jgi:hypothetical protein
MHDFPKVLNLNRGGKVRKAIMTQPHLHQGGCYDILRIAFVLI